MGNCVDDRLNYAQGVYSMYPSKVPHNFKGCNIYVGVVVWPPNVIAWRLQEASGRTKEVADLDGIEEQLMAVIAQKLDFKPKYYCYGIEDNGGDVNDALFEALNDNDVDVIMGAITSTMDRFRHLDVSGQYLRVSTGDLYRLRFALDKVKVINRNDTPGSCQDRRPSPTGLYSVYSAQLSGRHFLWSTL